MFRYTAEILPYHDIPFEVAVRELASLGFSEVNLWSAAWPLGHHVNPGDDVSSIRDTLDRYRVSPCGLTVYGKNQDEILERVDFAAELGIGGSGGALPRVDGLSGRAGHHRVRGRCPTFLRSL